VLIDQEVNSAQFRLSQSLRPLGGLVFGKAHWLAEYRSFAAIFPRFSKNSHIGCAATAWSPQNI
jgi:hypothetical protein